MIQRLCLVCGRAGERVPEYCKWCEKQELRQAKALALAEKRRARELKRQQKRVGN